MNKVQNNPSNRLELPRLTVLERIREAARLTWQILRTGDHVVARALSDGMDIGMSGGFAAALGEFNAALVAQGIDPIRGI